MRFADITGRIAERVAGQAASLTDRRFAVAAIAVVALHLTLGYTHESGLRPDDDRLYLHYIGAQFNREAESTALHRRVQDALQAADATENQRWRFDERQEYRANYLLPTLIYRLAGDALRSTPGVDPRRDYPAYLARAMFSGYVATWLLVATSFVLLVWSGREVGWIVAAAAAVAAIASLHTVFHILARFGIGVSGGLLILPDVSSDAAAWDVSWQNIVGLLLNPGPPSTIFGDTPRHHFNLLALGVFLLRWRGSLGASYAWLLSLSLVHQSHVGLLTLALLVTDLILRPSALVSWAGALAAAAIMLAVSRETLGSLITGGASGTVLLTGVAAVLVAILGYVILRATPVRSPVERVRHRLLSRGPVAADLIVLAGLWLGSLVVAAAFNANASQLQGLYFWRLLHGRLLAILRPALVLAAAQTAIVAMSRVEGVRGLRRAWVIALGASMLALVPSAAFVARQPLRPIAALERGLRRIDAAVPAEIDWTTIGKAREAQIYYSLLRDLERRR